MQERTWELGGMIRVGSEVLLSGKTVSEEATFQWEGTLNS